MHRIRALERGALEGSNTGAAAADGVAAVVVVPVANTATGAPDAGVRVERMPGGATQVPRMRAQEKSEYLDEHSGCTRRGSMSGETAGRSRLGVAAAEGPSM